MNRDDFGELFRMFRKRAGLTQQQVAEAIDVDFTYVSRIECGKAAPPARDRIATAAVVLRLSAEERDLLFSHAAKVPRDVEEWLRARPYALRLLRDLSDYPDEVQESVVSRLTSSLARGPLRNDSKRPARKGKKK
jgi:transcriptional regulator with XRE-family HTH domain